MSEPFFRDPFDPQNNYYFKDHYDATLPDSFSGPPSKLEQLKEAVRAMNVHTPFKDFLKFDDLFHDESASEASSESRKGSFRFLERPVSEEAPEASSESPEGRVGKEAPENSSESPEGCVGKEASEASSESLEGSVSEEASGGSSESLDSIEDETRFFSLGSRGPVEYGIYKSRNRGGQHELVQNYDQRYKVDLVDLDYELDLRTSIQSIMRLHYVNDPHSEVSPNVA